MDAAAQGLPLVGSQDSAERYIRGQTREHARIQDAPGNHGVDAEEALQPIEGSLSGILCSTGTARQLQALLGQQSSCGPARRSHHG